MWKSSVAAHADGVTGQFASDGLNASNGRLILYEIQPAGGKRMSWDAYVRGHPAIVGAEVVPGP